ncbi:manganese efflux pump MntP family protein [Romboutsia hominis]|uniref:Putative manganese efflux pump MntP n=1 Tax=Romboutsia hominis TaxID=1507512 RepID=A0A2P2BSX3_9FIRM|nr:manganese efflux pump MntP family protein [Romboutsia hominis]MCH1960708.1 manganese efflux pump MntP family protein [Romboutsia hominis]MCH1968860.1 manganese efflux pump MntP family protein [Romboutsia hominis]CEI73440.1 Probable manganese efflux pump MntP [mntP] [Romboutsia hominis]
MGFLTIFFTAFALSMDAFAVSLTKGMTLKNINFWLASKVAFFFGLFQGGMPLIGYLLGVNFESYIKAFDHWIALILLSFLGLKMILDAKDKPEDTTSYYINNKDLIILSIATSIDALAVGVSFSFLSVNIIPISITISLVTFIVCFLGVLLGKKIGNLFKSSAQIIGGVLLILIGLNIFNNHTGIINLLF